MGTRKNQATLSAGEKSAFINAVLALKNNVPSQIGLSNRYDDYVQIHMDSMMTDPGWAHRGPAFCPWHRVLLRNLELDLQAVDATVNLPYWDWTVQNSSDPTVAGSPWADNFMGGNGDSGQDDKVMTGPFRFDAGNWSINVRMGTPSGSEKDDTIYLRRRFGVLTPTLPTPANVKSALAVVPYDATQWNMNTQPSFRNRLEGWYGAGSINNRVHVWVGGNMMPMTSPNDPVFFLHHCNIDRLWAEWQRTHPQEPYMPNQTSAGAPQGHRLKDPMQPWGNPVTVESTLNHQAMGYQYDTDPPQFAPLEVHPIFETLPQWQHEPRPPHEHMKMLERMEYMGPMFDLSPEDKTAGGHDQETESK